MTDRETLRRQVNAASTCSYSVIDGEGIEGPCDRPALGWRWYQDVEHEDTLDAACDWHSNDGGALLAALLRDLDRAEAEAKRLQERVSAGLDLAERLNSLTGPCTGPGCAGCTAGKLRAALGGGDDQ